MRGLRVLHKGDIFTNPDACSPEDRRRPPPTPFRGQAGRPYKNSHVRQTCPSKILRKTMLYCNQKIKGLNQVSTFKALSASKTWKQRSESKLLWIRFIYL